MTRLRLKQISIKGFKYIGNEVTLDLDHDIILLLGPIGSGKTSILNAIEYALFGSTFEVRSRLLTFDDLINDFNDGFSISLTLCCGKKEYTIIRSRKRGARDVLTLIVDGKTISDERKAERYLSNLLKVDPDDFCRYIYIRHGQIEAIMYGPPARRSEIIDRMFGIEDLENIFRSISLKKFDDFIKNLEINIARIEGELKSFNEKNLHDELDLIERKIEQLNELKSKIVSEVGNLESQLTELEDKRREYDALIKKKSELEYFIEKVRRDLDKGFPRLNIIQVEKVLLSLAEILEEESFSDDAKELRGIKVCEECLDEVLHLLKDKLPLLKRRLEEHYDEMYSLKSQYALLESERIGLESELEKVTDRLLELKAYKKSYDRIVKREGDTGTLEKRITELREKIKETEIKVRNSECIVEILCNLIRSFPGKKSLLCPICRRKIPADYLDKLRSYLSEVKSGLFAKYSSELDEMKSNIRRLESIRHELEELNRKLINLKELELKVHDIKNRLNEVDDELSQTHLLIEDIKYKIDKLSVFLAKAEDLAKKIEHYVMFSAYRKELEDAEAELREINNRLLSIDFNPEFYDRIRERYFHLKGKLDELNMRLELAVREKKELEDQLKRFLGKKNQLFKLRKKLNEAKNVRADLVKVKACFREIQSELRSLVLAKVTGLMNQVFKSIYMYPDYNAVDIQVIEEEYKKEDISYKRSIYEILCKRSIDGSWISVAKKMSDGQKSIISLAFLLSIYKLTSHNLSFMILDEPMFNIDERCKGALLEILAKKDMISQLLLATQDLNTIKALSGGKLNIEGVVYLLQHGERGPRIKKYALSQFKESSTFFG